MVRQLILSGYPLNDTKQGNFTALHIASSEKDEESIKIVKLLIKNKADLNIISDNFTTPLSEAVLKENMVSMALLLKNGAKSYFDDMSIRTKSPFFRSI